VLKKAQHSAGNVLSNRDGALQRLAHRNDLAALGMASPDGMHGLIRL